MANKPISEHIIVDVSIEDLKNGNALWVVLYPDAQRKGQPTVESYLLKNILILGDEFWATFGSIHHSGALYQAAISCEQQNADSINASIPSAYAYSSRYEFVCNFSSLMGLMRWYSSHAYSKIRFRGQNSYQLVWSRDEPGAFDILYECVESGYQLKVSITDEQGATLVLPVHTPEVYSIDGRARLLTEYDALPKILRDEAAIGEVNVLARNAANEQQKTEDLEKQGYPSTPVIGAHFDSTLYSIDCFADGRISVAQWDIHQKEFIEKTVGPVQVFAEKLK